MRWPEPPLGIALAMAACLLAGVYLAIQRSAAPARPRTVLSPYLHVPTGSGLPELAQAMVEQRYLRDTNGFARAADAAGLRSVRAGRFALSRGLPLKAMLARLGTLPNEPVRLVVQGVRTKYELAEKMGRELELDSAELVGLLSDSAFLAPYGTTPENALTVFVPNTYFVYWNTSAKGFVQRMARERERFWTPERTRKARAQGLRPDEVYVLASIVEKETNQNREKPRIAGVYLNRLRTDNWRLEADPTVIFAVGDFSIRRLRAPHLSYDSPYNTYLYRGLPPGPICMPSIASLEAVLDAEQHGYWFFCANVDGSGFHHFSENFQQHKDYAQRWHEKMDREGVAR
jgi:UPF0755 protein